MSADRSERSGIRLNVPSILLPSTSIQVGFSRCSATSIAALMRDCNLAFSRIETTSLTATLKEGTFTTYVTE